MRSKDILRCAGDLRGKSFQSVVLGVADLGDLVQADDISANRHLRVKIAEFDLVI